MTARLFQRNFSLFSSGFKKQSQLINYIIIYCNFLLGSVFLGKSFMAVLGAGKGTWGHVARLIAEEQWDKIVLISNDWGKANFKPAKECDWILLNNRSGFDMLKDMIKEKLPEGKIAVSLVSGSGKEHMALVAALKEAGREIELVTLTGQGTKYY